jgi:heme exporter protein A
MSRVTRIEARGLTRLYGNTAALRGVNVVFEPGPITFIEGPNGAGKSTLLGIIGTLIRPTAGQVSYGAMGSNRLAVRQQLGWVAHDSRCYRELTARQNVELTARLYGLNEAGAWDRVCGRVGAQGLADRAVGTLSRGQRQRVALARALVHAPSVLLLDEPLSGLDAAAMKSTEEILVSEAARGTIVIVVSHDAGLSDRLAGRRLQLVGGRIEQDRAAPRSRVSAAQLAETR